MDALKRPLRISPEFGRYAEEKGLFDLYQRMLVELLVVKPDNSLAFLSEFLSRAKDDVPRIIVYGPPASGQHTVSKLVVRKLKTVHIQPQHILEDDQSPAGEEARSLKEADKDIPDKLWVQLIQNRVKEMDCVTKGWVLEGFPRTRMQALALQAAGVMAKHFVHLDAPDSVLMERYAGKRIDSLTGDVYHTVFALPKTREIESRLIEPPGGIEQNMTKPLTLYHRHTTSLLTCYSGVSKKFDSDQPLTDLTVQVIEFLCSRARSVSPRIPRVLLLGPTGSGKSLQASQLAKKYHLVDVDCKLLIKQTLASGSKLADAIKPFCETNMLIPDDTLMLMLSKRLEQLDCMTRGFVLHGFPITIDQAEQLDRSGHKPNRVFFLNIPEDSIKERLTLRRTDPVTGERYHLLFKPPPTHEVKKRLLIHPRYTEESVMERISSYNSYVEELMDYYESATQINADQDPLTVFECLESVLIKPLPKTSPANMHQISSTIATVSITSSFN